MIKVRTSDWELVQALGIAFLEVQADVLEIHSLMQLTFYKLRSTSCRGFILSTYPPVLNIFFRAHIE